MRLGLHRKSKQLLLLLSTDHPQLIESLHFHMSLPARCLIVSSNQKAKAEAITYTGFRAFGFGKNEHIAAYFFFSLCSKLYALRNHLYP